MGSIEHLYRPCELKKRLVGRVEHLYRPCVLWMGMSTDCRECVWDPIGPLDPPYVL